MGTWPLSDERLRAMYPGGRADQRARRFARLWAAVFGLGLMPRRWVTLEVAGRRSGQVTRFPLGMAGRNGQWYLVPMLGEQCNWAKNVRAAGGQVSLRRRRRINAISARRDGSALQVAGSIPVTLSDWGIKAPAGYGFLGSLADHGVAEFLLVLHRA